MLGGLFKLFSFFFYFVFGGLEKRLQFCTPKQRKRVWEKSKIRSNSRLVCWFTSLAEGHKVGFQLKEFFEVLVERLEEYYIRRWDCVVMVLYYIIIGYMINNSL